jgi:hypothetical protein
MYILELIDIIIPCSLHPVYSLEDLYLHTLRKKTCRLNALFPIQVYLASELRHSFLDTAGLAGLQWYVLVYEILTYANECTHKFPSPHIFCVTNLYYCFNDKY